MGLDQYFYKTKKSILEKDIQELNRKLNYGNISLEKFEEIAECIEYFNKNYELQEVIFEVWKKKKKNDDIDNFNYKFLNLLKDDIEFIIQTIEDDKIIKIMKELLRELEDNNLFFYSSW